MDKIKDKSYLLLLTDLLTGREQCTTSDHMIHWEHFSDVFMTSAITGDGVDELRVIIMCCLHVVMVIITIATLVISLSARGLVVRW